MEMNNGIQLHADEFADFFAELNDGNLPFTWQQELLDHIVEKGRWPDRIVAPTGAGKSSVVDVHLFANALAACGHGPRVPRRLHVVVDRRALVDNQADRATRIQEYMAGLIESNEPFQGAEVSYKVARLLLSFQVQEGAAPFSVGHLRGELSNRSLPINEVSACAVIAATPDMWGSRLLFRGYGSSKQARPRETAFVAMDSVLVLDEAHLNRQLLYTARRVAELQEWSADIGIPRLQVVETTATPMESQAGFTEVGVDIGKLNSPRDRELLRRVESKKKLVRVPLEKWTGRPGNAPLVKAASGEIARLLNKRDQNKNAAIQTVGCIVNHVDTAMKIAETLRKTDFSVQLIVGRMRPYDVQKLRQEHPKLFTCRGDDSVDVVVATQTLEVGVDIDFSSLVTEVAPATALAQRFGRVNRLGKRDDSEVVVLEPTDYGKIKATVAPYDGDDLRGAGDWLNQLEKKADVNPRALLEVGTSVSKPKRLLYQRPELVDILELSRTYDDLYAELDLDLFLHDSLDGQDALGGIVVRDQLPQEDPIALEILNTFPPRVEEVFPASVGVLDYWFKQLVVSNSERFKQEERDPSIRRRAFLFRNDEVVLCGTGTRLRPGDILVIDQGISFTTEQVAVGNGAHDRKSPQPVELENTRLFVFEADIEQDNAKFFTKFVGKSPDEATGIWQEAGNTGEIVLSSVVLDVLGKDEVVAWFAVVENGKRDESEVHQEWTPSSAVIYLDDHQSSVAKRARSITDAVGLSEFVTEEIVLAAQHHDDGKVDRRFQAMLGRKDGSKPYAKSEVRTRQEARTARQRSGLPKGWRHEQLSVVLVAEKRVKQELECSDLALRIIGCSHGYGRSTFPHPDQSLIDQESNDESVVLKDRIACSLFGLGKWDELIEATNLEYGPYVTAYLESVERAADVQISMEGK